jgi:hypothetical protein
MAELPHLQRRFQEAHRTYASRPGFAYPPHLIGDSEAANRTAGKPAAPPVLIGNAAKAAEVLRLGRSGPRAAITSGADAVLAITNALRVPA